MANAAGQETVRVLKGEDVWAFLGQHSTTIVDARFGATAESVHPAIRGRFLYWREPSIPIVVVDLADLTLSPGARLLVAGALSAHRMQPDFSGRPPAGYYLFRGRKLEAYHEGSVDYQTDQVPLAVGLAGIAVALLTSTPEIVSIGAKVATWGGAVRAADHFEAFLRTAPGAPTSPAGPPRQPSTEAETAVVKLRRAYQTLGLTENATDEEVETARRRLAQKHHPDKYSDQAEKDAATRRMTEMNVARDTIIGRPR